jgi:dTMP kinase
VRGASRTPKRGLLITFEGIEGSGKSTQVGLLSAWLREKGYQPLTVREPGGTRLGEALRTLVLERGGVPIDARAELFVILAARSQLVAEVIRPALARGAIVLADRFGDASVAYQGGGRSLGLTKVRSLVRFATSGITPDRTYLLDLPPEIGLPRVRARGRPDRLEAENLAFHRRVRAAYREIASQQPKRVRLLRAQDPPERIAGRIRRDLARILTIPSPGRRRSARRGGP